MGNREERAGELGIGWSGWLVGGLEGGARGLGVVEVSGVGEDRVGPLANSIRELWIHGRAGSAVRMNGSVRFSYVMI